MTRPRITVDRLEGEAAVLVLTAYGETVTMDWPRLHLPAGIEEGDVLELHIQLGKRSARHAEDKRRGRR